MNERKDKKAEDRARGSGRSKGTTQHQDHRLTFLVFRDRFSRTWAITNKWLEENDRMVCIRTVWLRDNFVCLSGRFCRGTFDASPYSIPPNKKFRSFFYRLH